MQEQGRANHAHPLSVHGIRNATMVWWNQSTPALYEHAIRRGEGLLAHLGPLVAVTGQYTGRAPNDRFVVREPSTEGQIWWGKVNRPIEPAVYDTLRSRVLSYLQRRELFVQDCYSGADPEHQVALRVVNELAWHNLFARNMFIQVRDEEKLVTHKPEYTILHAPGLTVEGEASGVNSEAFVAVHLGRKEVIIGGTHYAGEIKKSMFSIMNFLLPQKGILPMHCSANYGETEDDAALFFGLSGTGKTTLSADSSRTLIGDDEHGWSDKGVFNLEGGCYAKVIRLSPEGEPEIYHTTRRFGTILENVAMDSNRRLGSGLRPVHREYEGVLSHPSYPQRDQAGDGGAAQERRLSDRRRLRGPASGFEAHPGPGDVPLPVRIHGQGGWNGAGSHRTPAQFQRLLRSPLPASAPDGVRGTPREEIGSRRRRYLAGEHRVERRAVRSGKSDEVGLYACHGSGHPGWHAGKGAHHRGSLLRTPRSR